MVVSATLRRAPIAGSEGRLSKAKQILRELHETGAFDPCLTLAAEFAAMPSSPFHVVR